MAFRKEKSPIDRVLEEAWQLRLHFLLLLSRETGNAAVHILKTAVLERQTERGEIFLV